MTVVDWLLDCDPAIRWQVLRDLTHAHPRWSRPSERASSTRAGALGCSPSRMPTASGPAAPASRRATRAANPGQPWTATMHTLQTLQLFGLDPASERRPAAIAAHRRATAAGSTPGSGSSTARSSPASTAARSRPAPTSGWTSPRSSTGSSASSSPTAAGTARPRTGRCAPRSTRRSTCSTGCSSSSARPAARPPSREARRGGEEYLLERGLFRRKSTGEVVDPACLDFAFPYYWRYDVLRALDYFRGAGADPDPRMAEAVDLVRSKQQPDGRWLLDRIHPGRVHFDLEDGVGKPSRWNTLRALRVLDWWDGAAPVRRGREASRSPAADHIRSHPSRSG